MTFSRIDAGVLKKYAKPVIHMRSQLEIGRLGLVLGAGVSKAFGLPDWNELVSRIAQDPRVKGKTALSASRKQSSQASMTQILFQHFKAKCYKSAPPEKHHTVQLEREIRRKWRRIITNSLYKGANLANVALRQHPYLNEYLDIVRRSTLTVNYNFDDTLERVLLADRPKDEPERGYETVWNARQQFRRRDSIIYHPNGFLPKNPMEGPSDELVFSEDAYADQLIDTMTGHYATLLHHLSKFTCLFLGTSLEDTTLRHLLRQSARLNPGHYHYYVAFVDKGKPVAPQRVECVRSANFDTYNLVTLFLRENEISALGRLISLERNDFKHGADEVGIKKVYHYYITGAVGVGKSSTVNHLKSFSTYDEWLEQRPPMLAKRPVDLGAKTLKRMDSWIAKQFARKNRRLSEEEEGIFVLDRCPLDPISFTPAKGWKKKAQLLRSTIAYNAAQIRVQPGHVILLIGEAEDLVLRAKDSGKEHDKATIDSLQSKLRQIYPNPGTTLVETQGMSVTDLVRRVAHIIHMEDHNDADLHGTLQAIAKGDMKCNKN